MHRIRLPFLLYSYLATELLAPFFASFLILYGVFFLVRLIPLLEVVLDLAINFPDFVRLFSYIFPHMLLYVIPMASMAGVIIGFTRLTNDREILALKACGISLRRMLPPVIMVSLVIATLTGFFSVQLIPAGQVAVRQLMFQLAKEKIDKGIKEKKFTEALGELVVYVDKVDEKEQWHGVYVSDMRNRSQPIVTMAESGHMVADVQQMAVTIVLNRGTLHNTEGNDNQIIRFSRYQLQIPLRPPTRIDGDDVTHIGKGAMSQQQLIQAAAEFGGPKTRHGIVYLSEYHHRLVLPVGCFILSLIGLPLGLQAGPGRRAAGIPLGLGIFVLYYVAFTICRTMVEDLVLPLVLGMWLPNILFAVLTALVFWRVEQERPIIPEAAVHYLTDKYEQYILPQFKRLSIIFRRVVSRREPEPDPAGFEAGKATMLIHADYRTNTFHLPDCEKYYCESCSLEFNCIKTAREAGFEPCKFCSSLINESNKDNT